MALLLVTLLSAALLIWFLPVRLTLQFYQHEGRAIFETEAAVAWWRVDLAAASRRQGRDQGAAGRRAPTPATPPWLHLWQAVEPPAKYLLRRIHCRRLELQVVVGARDAMTSALLIGALYAALNTALGVLSLWVRMSGPAMRMQVIPSFQGPVWRARLNCILTFRLGDAIVAAIWWLYRVRREPVLAAWRREQSRGKGVEGRVRASDSGPHENGDGKHQEHGGRQHRGR